MWLFFFQSPAHTGIYTYLHHLSLPDALPIYLGGDVAFGDAQHLGDLAGASLVEVEQEQGAVERLEGGDEAMQHAQPCRGFVVGAIVVGHVVDGLVERHRVPAPVAVAAQERDRNVQRDTVHPRREPARRIVARPRAPQLHGDRSEEHTSELQSLMRISYAVFCLKKKNNKKTDQISTAIRR